jgi:hypothetical protein
VWERDSSSTAVAGAKVALQLLAGAMECNGVQAVVSFEV